MYAEALYKALAVLFSLAMLGYALVLKFHSRSWVSPGVLFSLFWFLFTFFPLVVMFSVPVDPIAVMFIFICVFCFGLPSMVFNWQPALRANSRNSSAMPQYYSGKFLSWVFYSAQIVVLLCITMNLSIQGFTLAELTTNLIGSANKYLALRYGDLIEPNLFARVGVLLNYIGVCVGGLIVSSKRTATKRTLVFLLSFVPAVLHMVLYADKGTLFLCAAYFYSGVLVVRVHKGDMSLTNKKTNKIFFMGIILLTPLLLISFLARGIGDGTTSEIFDRLSYYLSSYAFGHLYAFSDWFSGYTFGQSLSQYVYEGGHTYGLSTFMSIFKALGDKTVIPDGFYVEYYNYRGLFQTNIYTIFRGLVQDFGILGSMIYMLLTGLLFSAAYYVLVASKRPALSVAVFMFMAGYIYTSFIISIMVWNSSILLLVSLSLVLLINKILNRGTHKGSMNRPSFG